MTYVDLRPDAVRPVRVLVDNTWRDGELEAYRQVRDGAWLGWVRWSEGVGVNHLDWFPAEAFESNCP